MWRRIIRCTLEPKILISVMWIIGDWFYTGKIVPYKVFVNTYYDCKREIKKNNKKKYIVQHFKGNPENSDRAVSVFISLQRFINETHLLKLVPDSKAISSCQPEKPAVLCYWVMPPKSHYGNCIWLNLMTSYPTTDVQISSG